MTITNTISFKTNDGFVHVGGDGYGELFIIFKGPRKGERGYDKLTRGDVSKLIPFLSEWMADKCQYCGNPKHLYQCKAEANCLAELERRLRAEGVPKVEKNPCNASCPHSVFEALHCSLHQGHTGPHKWEPQP